MNGLEEAIIFYESHLPKEMVEECRAETNNETGYMMMLIEKYNETSNHSHKELNIRTKNKYKSK